MPAPAPTCRSFPPRLLRAQENERRTLARELHDEVGQSLSAILMEAENAECADDPAKSASTWPPSERLAEKTVNEVRDLALLLRPSMLDDFGLVPALNWHAREMTKRTGLNVVVSADDDADDLPDEHKTCIYRLVQEAVNNSARHANARTVEVDGEARRASACSSRARRWRRLRHALRPRPGPAGHGRARAPPGRASLQIDSQLGRGTLITAELPAGRTRTATTEMMPIRILLADDHTVVRDGLRALLEKQPDMTVVGEAADGRDSVRLAEEQSPDVVVMDIAMPNMNGIEATRRILAANPAPRVVILSMHQDESYVLRSLKAGAKGYLLKDSLRGGRDRSHPRGGAGPLVSHPQGQPHPAGGLRPRSWSAAAWTTATTCSPTASGRSCNWWPKAAPTRKSPTLLNVSLTTVETHRTHILQKLDLHSVPELILYAVRKGIIS